MKTMLIVLAVLILSAAAFAQVKTEIGFTGSVSGGLGYPYPNAGITGHVIAGNKAAFDGEGSYFFQAKKYTGKGQAAQAILLGRYEISNGLFLTGGMYAGSNFNSGVDRAAVAPMVGVGHKGKQGEIRVLYESTDSTDTKLRALWIDYTYQHKLTEKTFWSFRPRSQFASFLPHGALPGTSRHNGARLGATISVGF